MKVNLLLTGSVIAPFPQRNDFLLYRKFSGYFRNTICCVHRHSISGFAINILFNILINSKIKSCLSVIQCYHHYEGGGRR